MHCEDEPTLADVMVELRAIKAKQEELEKATKGLRDAWDAGGKLLGFVKWASMIVTAVTAAWYAIYHMVTFR